MPLLSYHNSNQAIARLLYFNESNGGATTVWATARTPKWEIVRKSVEACAGSTNYVEDPEKAILGWPTFAYAPSVRQLLKERTTVSGDICHRLPSQ